jgi:hypothetical protein
MSRTENNPSHTKVNNLKKHSCSVYVHEEYENQLKTLIRVKLIASENL